MSSPGYAENAPALRLRSQDGPRSWAWSLSQRGLQGPPGSLPASSHPLARVQTVGIAGQDRVPVEQGLFRLPQLLQQRCQFAPRHDIGWTHRESILKPTDSCNPFLARRIGHEGWWFYRADSVHRHARAPLLFGLL